MAGKLFEKSMIWFKQLRHKSSVLLRRDLERLPRGVNGAATLEHGIQVRKWWEYTTVASVEVRLIKEKCPEWSFAD